MPDQPQPGVYPAGVAEVSAGLDQHDVVVRAHNLDGVVGGLVVHDDQPNRTVTSRDAEIVDQRGDIGCAVVRHHHGRYVGMRVPG